MIESLSARGREVTGPVAEASRGGPVLVVDDDLSIRTVVTEILELEGYPVVAAANGEEALALVESAHPSLVLLDLWMPVLDGWGFVRAARERGLSLPIVIMTAAQDGRRWAAELGAQDYLGKPFDLADLVTVVERLFPQPGSGGVERRYGGSLDSGALGAAG